MKTMEGIRSVCCLYLVFCTASALSATLYVGPADPYQTVQSAIEASVTGDTIIVSPGNYPENINFLGKNITVTSTNPDDPAVVETTVIDAGGSGSAVKFVNGEGPQAVLSGFTITGGYGTVNPDISATIYWGAGIYCENASPTITQNMIKGNNGPLDGQTMAGYGGGIACFQSNSIVTRNIIMQNISYAGSGIIVYLSSAILANNIIRDNSATIGGGVILLMGGDLIHNTVIDNTAQTAGNIYADADAGYPVRIINNIIVNASNGGGIYCQEFDQYISILYNDVWNNTGGNYNNLPDQTGLNGNISINPAFINGYHISASSSCYETGDPAFSPYSWQRDIDGQAAVMNWRPDIGADEVTGNARPVADAGPDQQVHEIQEITLNGTASYDRDISDVLTYTWTQVSGPTVELSDWTAAQPVFLPEVEAGYKFELVVSDGVLTSCPDEVLVVVGNRAPIADAGADKLVQVGSQVRFDGSGSYDPDPGNVLSYVWTQVSGPVVELQEAETATPYFNCVEEGVYVFELVASDGYKQSLPDSVEFVTINMTVEQQEYDFKNIGTYAHYGDVSGDKVVYGVGSACDVTWNFKYKNLANGQTTTFSGYLIQPKIDGDTVVWFKYGNGWGNPWYHEPSNCSVFAKNIVTGTEKTLRAWTWSDSYGHPVISGKKVIWVEHHGLDPHPTGSPEANNWWNTPYSICGADITNWDSPTYFTVAENVGRHDPYPCHTYAEDFDDVIDIFGNIVVWEGDGNIYGADISNLNDIRIFVICDASGRQYDPAISGHTVVWTDERNDGGDIYGADISDRNNIKVFEVIKQNGIQQQAAIDGLLIAYVNGGLYDGQIKFGCLTKNHGVIDIPLNKNYYGIGPAVDKNVVVWQSATYGEALGISLKIISYSIADGSVHDITKAKRYDYIQHAITEAVGGDEIVVDPGVYQENINLKGKNLILRSSEPTNLTVIKKTVIQGREAGPVVTFAGTETSACCLRGFTITGGVNSGRGGGIAGNSTHAGIFNCSIQDNAAAYGGGIDSFHGRIEKCIIANNSASMNGGGFAVCGGVITNCLVYGNSAGAYGGGLNYCNGTISNCTIADNTASSNGGGLNNCTGIIANNIIWGNSIEGVFGCSLPTYSCYPGATGTNNISVDPMFVDPNSGDYHLLPDSPCINAGDPAYTPYEIETDLDGWFRIIAPAIDMGCFELDGQHPRISFSPKKIVFYVSDADSLTDEKKLFITNSGFSTLIWQISEECPWLTIRPSSGEMNEVLVSVDANELPEGIYSYMANISADDAVNSNQPFEIVLHVDRTVLHVPSEYKSIQSAIYMSQNEDTIVVSPGIYHENIQLNGKNIILTSTNPQDLEIVASTIIQGSGVGSVVTFAGTETSACVLRGLTITGGNSATSGGGVIGNDCAATIQNCHFYENAAAAGAGGGIWGVHGRIDNCILYDNSALWGGGIAKSNGILRNCLIYDNQSPNATGLNNCDGTIQNCTIVSDQTAPLLRVCDGTIKNCILSTPGPVFDTCTAAVSYTRYPGATGSGNISADPMFVGPDNGDYHLLPESPCIDAGNPASDYSLEPMPNGGRIDMGAYGNTPQATLSRNVLTALGFEVIDKTRVGRTLFEYQLAVTVRNPNTCDMTNVQMKLRSWDAAVVSVGDDMITIDSIPAGATVTSTDTFNIVLDRSMLIVPGMLTWDIVYYEPAGQAQQTMMSMAISMIDNTVPGDITDDGRVNLEDFIVLSLQWNQVPGSPSADIALPQDGHVGIEDLMYLAENWLN